MFAYLNKQYVSGEGGGTSLTEHSLYPQHFFFFSIFTLDQHSHLMLKISPLT